MNTNLYKNGGIEREVEEFGRYIGDFTDHRLVTVVVDPSKPSGKKVHGGVTHYNLSLPNGLTSHQIYSEVSSLEDFKSLLSPLISRIGEIIRDEDIQLDVSQGTFYLPWCNFQAALENEIPIVEKYAGVLSIEEKHKPTTTPEMRGLFRDLEGSFNHKEVFTIFPSELTKSAVRNLYGNSKGESIVIPNGISEEFFKDGVSSPIYSRVGFIGRYSKIKNPEFMFAFANYLNSHGIPIDIHLVTDSEKVDLDTPKNVRFHNPMNTSDLQRFYQMVGVVLSPSLFETYGNVPVESVASGTTAMISDNMGVREVFESIGLENLIINFESDLESVAFRVRENLANPPDLNSARASLRAGYTWDAIFNRMVNLFEEVAA